ncbi:MAG: hypothetical protein GF383_15115 [Candidatus Lokiarchaeota archaeon]|nr:hypothetical protein [Candidatus Lokiarchaeota archaeon]MBD3342846.1 hypothetical protein [Candidatus Lokiarchaeota archaeon]
MDAKFDAILFDIDGTLLDVDMNTFMPEFFAHFSDYFCKKGNSEKITDWLLKALNSVRNNNGRYTNEYVFLNHFSKYIDTSPKELRNELDLFFRSSFPNLKNITQKKPSARKVVEKAFNHSNNVIISTDPIVPLIAAEKRLEWAGVANFSYNLITTYENSCTTKFSSNYFKNIFKLLQLNPKKCLVVGNETDDMKSSLHGCSTFLVDDPYITLEPNTPHPTYKGKLIELLEII